jgi:hypothetical protein
MSVERMNLTAETFTITNDLMKKTIERFNAKTIKKALSVLPQDF